MQARAVRCARARRAPRLFFSHARPTASLNPNPSKPNTAGPGTAAAAAAGPTLAAAVFLLNPPTAGADVYWADVHAQPAGERSPLTLAGKASFSATISRWVEEEAPLRCFTRFTVAGIERELRAPRWTVMKRWTH